VGTGDLTWEDMEKEIRTAQLGARLAAGIVLSVLEAAELWACFSQDECSATWMGIGEAEPKQWAPKVASYCHALVKRRRPDLQPGAAVPFAHREEEPEEEEPEEEEADTLDDLMTAQAELEVMRRQRDSALRRIAELVGDIETHREFWRRGRAELEEAKTDACQAHNRAQRLQARVRAGTRREVDRQNAALREAIVRRMAADYDGVGRALLTDVITDADHLLGKTNASLLREATLAIRRLRGDE